MVLEVLQDRAGFEFRGTPTVFLCTITVFHGRPHMLETPKTIIL